MRFGSIAPFTFIITALCATTFAAPPRRIIGGPSAQSLAVHYTGPIRANPFAAQSQKPDDPIRRAADWRYYYSAPMLGYFGWSPYSWSYYWHRPYRYGYRPAFITAAYGGYR